MDDGNLGNNHRNIDGESGDRLSAESLPLIDTRLLSQSEIRALSHCSSLSPSSSASLAASAGGDDDLTPKIDRSVFNESSGSRKQTFLRIRLARHPPPPRPPSPQRQRDDSSREEKSQVASLLRSLFSVDSIHGEAEEDQGEDEVEENEGQPLISYPIHNNSNVHLNPYFDSVQNVLVQGISGNETKRRRGRPRKILNPSDAGINEESEFLDSYAEPLALDKTRSNLGTESRHDASGISMDSNPGKRKRCRPPKRRDGCNQPVVNCKREDKEEIVNLENREGTVVDLSALANIAEDPYGEELRRLTLGFVTKEEFLGLLEQLNGEWVNTGKKKKVVKACDFGGYLPRGWKLMLCIKKKGINLWLACRRYLSPDGQEFATCKEVSTYLQSLLESRSKNQLNSLHSHNKTLGQPVMANESLVGNFDSMDLPVLNLESKRTSSGLFDEAKGTENGDITDVVKTSLVEKDDTGIPAAVFVNGNKEDDINRGDYNMDDNLMALSNSEEAQFGDNLTKKMQCFSSTTENLLQFRSSQNP